MVKEKIASVAGMAISGYGMIGASSIILRIGGGFLLVNSFDEAIVIESGESLLVSGLENLGVSRENALRGKLAANIASIPISLAPAFIATPGLIGKLGTPFKITEDIPIITAKDLISGKPLHGILEETIRGTKIFGYYEGKPLYNLGGGSGPVDEFITLYHGTTKGSGNKIFGNSYREGKGFKLGEDGNVFFANEYFTAAFFAEEAAIKTSGSIAVYKLRIPTQLAKDLGLDIVHELGLMRGAKPIPIGSGVEYILHGADRLKILNDLLKSKGIKVQLIQVP